MNALTADEAASVERVRQRYFQPGQLQRGLNLIMREFESREECVAVAERTVSIVRSRKAKRKAISDVEIEAAAKQACSIEGRISANVAFVAAVLTGVKLRSSSAPAVLALLKVAGAA
jgi:hypothetical protein